jgi:hypothetical protein
MKKKEIITDRESRNGLSLGLLLLLLSLATLGAALSLDVVIVDSEGLVDLGLQSGVILNTVKNVS